MLVRPARLVKLARLAMPARLAMLVLLARTGRPARVVHFERKGAFCREACAGLKGGGGTRMDPNAEYGGSAGNWTRTGQDWMGAVNVDRAGALWEGGLSAADAWAAATIALGGVGVCACAALLCWRWRAGRAVEVAVTY